MDFIPYPKTPRLKRNIVITEKIDGSNAQVVITLESVHPGTSMDNVVATKEAGVGGFMAMRAGSRNRWVTPGKDTDNYGFAGWVQRNAADLFSLGEGQHFGEWWGLGIARSYGQDRKRFSLFNTARWGLHNPNTPACCDVVPVLFQGDMSDVDKCLGDLRLFGSRAAPGFMTPEGIIVYHSAAKQSFKVLIENDDERKGGVRREHDQVAA